MSNSKFKLTGENTNLSRVAQMILGPCTNVLRDVLKTEISPAVLEKKVRAYVTNTKKPQINKHQEALVYGHDYSKFDVTLLYFLLRNVCSIQPHSNKWGKNPSHGDKSVSANIERIRLIRNEYGHNSETSISDTDFKQKYQDIKDIVQELEKNLGSSTKYQDEVKELETCPMDPTQSEKNIKELLDLHETIKEMKNTVVPWNIKVIYEKDILKWKEDDSFFVETHNFQAMLDKVRQQPFVTFVGVPGSGKTATARHIALLLQEKDGYEILPTKDIRDIETYCNPCNSQVFVIDDVLGVFGFDMKNFEKLSMYKDRLNRPTMPETRVLMTCREIVFKHEVFSGSFLSNEKHVVQLHSEENALNDQDIYDLLAKYNIDKDLLSADTFSNISKSFPYLCKYFSRKEELRYYGSRFFISPVPYIIELLDTMKSVNNVYYASLVLLMTNKNALSKEDFKNEHTENFNKMNCEVLERCKVESSKGGFNFIDALTEMVGTYTEERQSGFKFVHDSMYEIVAWHFGRCFPELMLQYMDSDYIANYIKTDRVKTNVNVMEERDTVAGRENVNNLCITLQEPKYQLLVDRLFKDIKMGKLFNVFENEALKHPLVLQKFLDVMKKMLFSELQSVFLQKFEFFPKKNEKPKYNEFFKIYYLLLNSRYIKLYRYSCVRVISFVIFYGHNQVLQYIIDQIKENTKRVDHLFQTPFNKGHDGWDDFCAMYTTMDSAYCDERSQDSKIDVSDEETRSDSDSSGYVYTYDNELYSEPVIVEKRRLLLLACCSGDIQTLQALLPCVDKDVLNHDFKVLRLKNQSVFTPPLIFACGLGKLDIVLELLQHGANINITSEYDTPLTAACSKGHLETVHELLKKGADVNINVANKTPIIAACSSGSFETVVELLKYKADINIKVDKNTPLIAACSSGSFETVVELLKYKADVNIKVDKNTPLIAACSSRSLDIVIELLKHGADVNINVHNNSPLLAACSSGSLEIVTELLKNGADVDLKHNCETAVEVAFRMGQLDIVLELLEHVAPKNIDLLLIKACSIGRLDKVLELIKHGADVNIKGPKSTPLIAACAIGNLDVVLELIKHRAGVNVKHCGRTPLIAACLKGNLEIVLQLLENGADVNINVDDSTPLFAACSSGSLDIVIELLKHRADVNIKVENSASIFTACPIKSLEIVTELLKHRADVELKHYRHTVFKVAFRRQDRILNKLLEQRSPKNIDLLLIKACSIGRLDIVLELIKHGADVNIKGPYSILLIAACSNERLDIVLELIKYGADVNVKNCDSSPLIAACLKGNLEIVLKLLEHGADVNIKVSAKNDDEWLKDKAINLRQSLNVYVHMHTPLIAACASGNLDIVQVLLKHGTDVNTPVSYNTPLISACLNKHLNIVEVLLKHEADVNITVSGSSRFNPDTSEKELYKKNPDRPNICTTVPIRDNSPLYAACSNRSLDIVTELLKHGADPNVKVSEKVPLIVACLIGSLDIVRILLKHGADANITVYDNSPLIAACWKRNPDIVIELLKHKADVNMIVSDNSPLIEACKRRHLDIVLKLLKYGADVNLSSSSKAPLIAACSFGSLNILRQCLKYGANVNILVSKSTPLIAACSEGRLDKIHELLKHGANVNLTVYDNSPLIAACTEGRLNIVNTLLKHGAIVNIAFSNNSPLVAACTGGHLNIVIELIKRGEDVNITVLNNSPLIAACSQGNLDIVHELLKHGADVNKTVSNNSPLIAACSQRNLVIVHELLKHKADVNKTVSNNSPLIAACSQRNLDIVHELLKHGADVNFTVSNNSPLIAACSQRNLDIVHELLKHGADVNFTVSNNSPLIAACSQRNLDIVHELLKHGADVNFTVSNNSPLIAACSKRNLDIVHELLKHGADVNKTVSNNSPLIAACSEGRLDIVHELLKHGADVNFTVSNNSPLIAACSKEHLNIVLELLKNGGDVNITVSGYSPISVAYSEGHIDMIDVLMKHGTV